MDANVKIMDTDKAGAVFHELENQGIPVEGSCGCMLYHDAEVCSQPTEHCPLGHIITVPMQFYDALTQLIEAYDVGALEY